MSTVSYKKNSFTRLYLCPAHFRQGLNTILNTALFNLHFLNVVPQKYLTSVMTIPSPIFLMWQKLRNSRINDSKKLSSHLDVFASSINPFLDTVKNIFGQGYY